MPEENSSEVVKEQSEVVAAANLKVVGDGPAFYSNIALGNAVSHQQSMQQIQTALTGKIAEMIVHTSVSEGANDAVLTSLMNKIHQMMAPPTNLPTQGG